MRTDGAAAAERWPHARAGRSPRSRRGAMRITMKRVDDEIERLIGEDRLLEAARLASARGDRRRASRLFERACAWADAAHEARWAGEPARALGLAVTGGDAATAEEALTEIIRDPNAADRLAADLTARSQHEWAARIWEALGRREDAAGAFVRAGRAVRAAALHEARGDPRAAAIALEGALRRDPHAWAEASALGALLVRLGRYEAAVRTLQRIPTTAAARPEALAALRTAFERLGMPVAAGEIRAEMDRGPGPAAPRQRLAPPPPLASAARPAPHLYDRYRVLRQVASSPSARILECEDVTGGERVAIKIFAIGTPDGGRGAAGRLEHDLRALRRHAHPAIVPIRDVITRGPAVVLAWMDATLEDALDRGRFAPSRAAEVARAVLSALGDAHAIGILHRAVKPTNVLFDSAGVARLSDFGSAHMADVSTTASGEALGAWAYVSPEQRQGHPATPASDVYAAGRLLQWMLTGERPAAAPTATRSRPSEHHAELDARHDAVLDALTSLDPADRPPSALEAAAMIAALFWPSTLGPKQTLAVESSDDGVSPPSSRLEAADDRSLTDTWIGRRVELLPLSDATLVRARAFVAADHPALQTVWRADRATRTLWLQRVCGRELDRPLTAQERSWLGEALDALHAQGVCHGRVAREWIVLVEREGESEPVLRFEPVGTPDATPASDHRALAAL